MLELGHSEFVGAFDATRPVEARQRHLFLASDGDRERSRWRHADVLGAIPLSHWAVDNSRPTSRRCGVPARR